MVSLTTTFRNLFQDLNQTKKNIVVIFFASVVYIPWHYTFLLGDNLYDSLNQRIIIAFILFSIGLTSVLNTAFRKKINGIFPYIAHIPHLHISYLAFINHLSSVHALAFMMVNISTFVSFNNFRQARMYAVVTLVTVSILSYSHPEFNIAIFWISIGTSVAMFLITHHLNQKLADQSAKKQLFIDGIVTAMPGIVYIYSLEENKNIYCNREITDSLGYSAEEVKTMGRKLMREILHPEDWKAVEQAKDRIKNLKRGEISICRYRMRHADGRYRWLQTRDVAFERNDDSDDVSAILGITYDVTDEVLAIEEIESQRMNMLEAAKMASLGRLAGGISHEINNPLLVISALAQKTLHCLSKDQIEKVDLVKNLKKIDETVFRMAKIIKSMRSFARDGSKDLPEKIHFSAIIEDTLSMCQEKMKTSDVKFEVDQKSLEFFIYARQTEIVQIFVNLVNNAFDAVESVEIKWIKIFAETHSDKVKIFVQDSGPLISREIKNKMMQPFFSTKPAGKGSGLGLSISKKIIESHGGQILFDDNQEFTTFLIEFPYGDETRKYA